MSDIGRHAETQAGRDSSPSENRRPRVVASSEDQSGVAHSRQAMGPSQDSRDAVDDVLQEVCRMLEPFNKAKKPIGGDTDFLQDLDIDSLAIMNFMMKLEDRFDISIPLNVLPEMRTVDDLVATIHRVRGDA